MRECERKILIHVLAAPVNERLHGDVPAPGTQQEIR
jgi:hypothetical protein